MVGLAILLREKMPLLRRVFTLADIIGSGWFTTTPPAKGIQQCQQLRSTSERQEQYVEGSCPRPREASHPAFRIGNPAVIGRALRPVALRPCLSAGVPFSNELKSSHSLDCAVNFQRNSFPDIVKSKGELRIRDHKSLNFRLILDPQAVYLPEPLTRRRRPACHFRDSVRVIRAQSPAGRATPSTKGTYPGHIPISRSGIACLSGLLFRH